MRIYDYPYLGMRFRYDFDLPLLEEEEWSDSSMNEIINVFGFYLFCDFLILFLDYVYIYIMVFMTVIDHDFFFMTQTMHQSTP